MKRINCLYCKKPLTSHQVYEFLRGKMKQHCSRSCGLKSFLRIKGIPEMSDKKCEVCGKVFSRKPYLIKHQKTCSTQCAGRLASVRMTLRNPMVNSKTRDKVKKTLKRINHKPPIQGGNGKPMPIPQKILLKKLGIGFKGEYIFRTVVKKTKYGNLPNHYKIDIANPVKMIAIEVDGASHNSLKRKFQDLKKTDFLCSQKWKVLRFTNHQVITDLDGCLHQIKSLI